MAEKRKSPAEVMLRNVRLSYPSIYKAKGFGDGSEGEPKFSAVALMDPGDKQGKINIAKIEDAIDFVKKEKWPKGAPKLGPSKICLKDSEDLEEMKDGYEDMMYVTASDAKRPRVLDADGIDVREGDDGAPYAGCYVDMKIRVWAQDNKFGKRINASLVAVKFRADGDAFGAAPFDPDEFDEDDEDDVSPRRAGKGRDRDDERTTSRRSRDDEDDAPRSRRSSRDEDDEDEKPRSRRSSRDDDEDEKPRSRRSSRDEEEDERPRSRRGRDDEDEKPRSRRTSSRDDDEDDAPRSRRSSRDEDDEDEKPRSRRSSRDEEEDERPRSRRRDLA